MKKSWYEFPFSDIGSTRGFDIYWGEHGLSQLAIQNKQTLEEYSKNGMLKADLNSETFHDFFTENGAFLLKIEDRKGAVCNFLYSWDDSICRVKEFKKDNTINVSMITINQELLNKFIDYININIVSKISAGKVFIVIQEDGGFYLKSIGLAALPLETSNYTPQVISNLEHVVNDLKNKNPCGRITILDGPPGCGKTFAIKSLLYNVPKGMFIMIPTNLVSQLTSPTFIPMLLSHQKPGIPLILILEDSDSSLSSRMSDNIDSISTILNFGAGMLGELLDIRIIMTTNISIKEIDKAVTREGRLCRRIGINKLDKTHALEVYKRLTDKETDRFDQKEYTLAQVYSMAREDGYTPLPDDTIGFKSIEKDSDIFEDMDEDDLFD